MLDDQHIVFDQLAFEGDGLSGQHVCALRAAGNFLMDRADWYVKGAAVINQPYPIKGKTPPVVPEGWQLVPVEPTAYQVLVGRNANSYEDELCVAIYLAMLAAAPKPEDK